MPDSKSYRCSAGEISQPFGYDLNRSTFLAGVSAKWHCIITCLATCYARDWGKRPDPQGKIIPISGHGGMGYVFKAYLLSLIMRQHGSMYLASPSGNDLLVLKELLDSGKLIPVIDQTYPLRETPDAFRYLEKEHARGKVVITIA